MYTLNNGTPAQISALTSASALPTAAPARHYYQLTELKQFFGERFNRKTGHFTDFGNRIITGAHQFCRFKFRLACAVGKALPDTLFPWVHFKC
ncbi:hypothetical protein HMPREF9193_01266 [Treponema lecithinolyticum ATCC 700332]|uniref:Uncharacterized protein n=1 Tax=Treponema lecithinolyticum ATCC 700332 TaxID=1321815 RepID=A0ABN0NYC3_TRELE|nr:hypothetical protein HMPREF9193_01266 [Treponema lecithinolyticum ATCC 700332]